MKKIFVLLMIMTIILSGCSSGRRKTSTTTETNAVNETKADPAEKFYGTWRTCGIKYNGKYVSTEETNSSGTENQFDYIFIFDENGEVFSCNSRMEQTTMPWRMSDDENIILVSEREVPFIDGKLEFHDEQDEVIVYFEKISSSQDKDIINEIFSTDNSEPEQEVEEVVEEETSSTIRPDVKEAIDAYEEFVDEYIEFMKKYEDSNGTDLTLLVDYTKFISNLEEYTDKMEALEKDMTDAEVAYYLEVMNRCNEKMIKALD